MTNRFLLLMLFALLSTITSSVLWSIYGWHVFFQILFILLVAGVGENVVSSQGYYYYTRQHLNGPFVRRVPVWIMYLWVFSIQTSLLVSLSLGFTGLNASMMAGFLALLFDLTILEPYLSRTINLWKWTPVERGYFRFIPERLNRFTAPPGNYVVWYLFPFIANSLLIVLLHLL
ncbi:MAG: hypothetical protein ACP6KW_11870 [Candidatus Thorarchaeota archaeon]